MTEPAAAVAEDQSADAASKKHSPTRRIVSGVISLLIVGGIFAVGRREFAESVRRPPVVEWPDAAVAECLTSTEQVL